MPALPITWIALGFLGIALVYASIGFGGGSSYTAALAALGLSTALVPVISLSCNLIVSAGGAWFFTRRRHTRSDLIWPFLVTSIPCAYLGGRVPVAPSVFLLVLGLSLLAAAVSLLFAPRAADAIREVHLPLALLVGAALGFLSGLVGIGGGIFLAPALLLLRWGRPKEVAASATIFIFINSLAGLAGQLAKPLPESFVSLLLPLGLAVLVGGQLGSRLGSGPLPSLVVRRGTALLIALVGARLVAQSLTHSI